ncbi:hypothetical protein E2C01_029590 [Portunus trituberculatus]|uniref:Uncharacterized protein n=1 Tax=Portunus trituberculatus TaxID=210409 RepID=A0A5B7ETC2_PORTR|nr:hypothetical protein [Portunus trituberculatus]
MPPSLYMGLVGSSPNTSSRLSSSSSSLMNCSSKGCRALFCAAVCILISGHDGEEYWLVLYPSVEPVISEENVLGAESRCVIAEVQVLSTGVHVSPLAVRLVVLRVDLVGVVRVPPLSIQHALVFKQQYNGGNVSVCLTSSSPSMAFSAPSRSWSRSPLQVLMSNSTLCQGERQPDSVV